jgi:hypothetical protein
MFDKRVDVEDVPSGPQCCIAINPFSAIACAAAFAPRALRRLPYRHSSGRLALVNLVTVGFRARFAVESLYTLRSIVACRSRRSRRCARRGAHRARSVCRSQGSGRPRLNSAGQLEAMEDRTRSSAGIDTITLTDSCQSGPDIQLADSKGRSWPGTESQRTLFSKSHLLTSGTTPSRDLQTAPSRPRDLDHRGLDGLEGPLTSGASRQIALERCGQMPDSEPSSSHSDPKRSDTGRCPRGSSRSLPRCSNGGARPAQLHPSDQLPTAWPKSRPYWPVM